MANEFRKVTGNSISTEPSFKTTAAAIKHWINQLAKLGINVASHPLGEDDGIRAFSLYRSTKAIIVLNSDETDNGKLFSLMHELSHILLRNTGVCDLKRSEIENFCNRFASEILIPDGILSQLIEKYDVSDENSEDTSGKIARRLRVSKLAVLTRLLQEKIIKPTTYDKLSVEEYKKFSSLKQNKIERQKKNAASGKSTGVNPYLLNKARIGNYFLGELFIAYNSGKITPFEAGKYLGFKPKTINKFSEWASHNEA
jgi:Zn-dependent peptidase ImmA (M78 family)